MSEGGGRDLRLDGLRGLAILLVVAFHATYRPERQELAARLALTLPTLGFSGVDLFFVLSGFLITRILLERRTSENYYRTFYARRALRIFPAYYLVLLLVLVVIPQLGTRRWNDFWLMPGSGEPLWYWLYLSNFYDGLAGFFHHHFLAPAWSLAIEEQFYLVWPLLVAWLRPRTLERLCLALVVAAFGLRLVTTLGGGSPLAIYVLTPMRFDTLALGAWVALRSRREGGFAGLRGLALGTFPAAGALVLAMALMIQWDPRWLVSQPGRMLAHPVMQTLGYSALAVCYTSLLVLLMDAAPGSRLRRVFEWGWLRFYGRISYSVYLLHVPVIFAMTEWVSDPRHADVFAWAQLERYALALLGSTLLGWLSFSGLEQPVLRLRRHFCYRERLGSETSLDLEAGAATEPKSSRRRK